MLLLQEGGPLPGPQSGLLSNTCKLIVRGDTCIDKPRDFIEKRSLGREQQGKRTQEDYSAMGLRFYGDGLSFQVVPGQSVDSGSLLVVHMLLSQDGCQRGF